MKYYKAPKKPGEIHVYKPSRSPYWYIWFTDKKGKRVQKSTGLLKSDFTKEEIEQRLNSAETQKTLCKKNLTIFQFERFILDRLQLENRFKATIAGYKNAFDYFKNAFGENCLLQEMNKASVWKFKEYMLLTKKLNAVSINRYLALIHSAFEILVREEYIEKNPFFKYDKMKINKTNDPAFSDKEFYLFLLYLNSVDADSDYNHILRIMLFCGIRRQEALLIERSDVYSERGVFRLVNIKSRDKHKFYKGIPAEVKSDFEYFMNKYKNSETPFNFCHPTTLSKKTQKIFKILNITGKKLKSLRHTYSTRAIESGANARDIQKNLNHSSLSVTERYLHDLDVAPEINILKK